MTKAQWVALFGSEQAYLDAVMALVNEWQDVATFAVNHAADGPLAEEMNKHALIAATFNSPDCDPAWRRLATYTLSALDPRDELTEEQERIRATAQDIERIEHQVAAERGIDLYPRDRERALRRALRYLRPFLKTKETIQ